MCESQLAMSIVNSLLDIRQITLGKIQLNNECFEVAKILKIVKQMLNESARVRNTAIVIENSMSKQEKD